MFTDLIDPTATLAFGMPGAPEWIILLILGLLIFGRRLPEVGRSLGRGIVEFKKGIKGIEDDIEDSSSGQLPESSSSQNLAGQSEGVSGQATVETPVTSRDQA